MPFIEERQIPQNLTNIAPVEEPDDPTLLDTFGAAFRSENIVGSFLASRGMADPYEVEADFNAIDYVKDDAEFSPYVEQFAGVFNKRAADAKKLQIKRELADQRTIDAAGGMGIVASMAAGVFDLPTLIPVGGAAVGAGSGVARSAAGAAIGAGIDAAMSETGLQLTQTMRTGEQTAFNIGGSILLGGALGTLAGKYLSSTAQGSLGRKIQGQDKAFEEFDMAFSGTGMGTSSGAAARDMGPLTLKDEAIISRMPIVNQQDPLIRLQLSDFDTARQAVRGLAETPLEYADNARGVATEIGGSTETRMKMWNAPLAESLSNIDTSYARYFHGVAEPTAWQTRLSPLKSEFARMTGGQKLTYKQFKEEVGKAAFSAEQHSIPEVAEAARVYRQIDEAMKKAAIEAKLFPEDIKVAGDVSHLFRMYNKNKIIADRGAFGRILNDYFIAKRNATAKALDLENTVKAVDAKADKAAQDLEAFSRLDDAEIRDIVEETIDTILGNAEGRIPYDGIVSGPRGPLKERLLKIESSKIQDFMELDIEEVLHAQVRTMSADVELSRKFGSVDLKEEIRKINDEANAKIAKAGTPEERTRLDKQRKNAVRDVEGIRDRLRGQYALPANPDGLVMRAGRVARNLNYLRLLGGMTISAIPDMGKVVFTHGLTSTFRDGFIPMVRNFRGFRLAAKEVKQAGAALDMILDSRAMALADITGDFGRHSKFERGIKSLSSRFGVASLMAPWNASMKQFAGLVTMTNVLKASQRVAKGTATADDIRKLAAASIDEDLAKRIWAQFNGGDRASTTTATPAPTSGNTRFYYGASDAAHDVATQDELWVTPQAEYAKSYRAGNEPNVLWYVDIPDDRLVSLGVRDNVNNYNIIGKLPKDWAKKAKRLQEASAENVERFGGHGEIADGIYLPHGEKWDDRPALEAFRAAVVRDVDRIIVTPGQDKPLWMSTELGKTIGQFKSFGISSMQRTTLAGLQQRDAATLNGVMVMLGLGAMTYWAKQTVSGQPVSDNPYQWAVEAFDKSGLTGYLMEANNVAEKATRGRVGASFFTGEQVSRYASRNVTGAFLGPTPDAISDIFQLSGSIFAGDTSKADLRKARQLIPMQNLFYLRGLFNQVEEVTGDSLGLPDTRK